MNIESNKKINIETFLNDFPLLEQTKKLDKIAGTTLYNDKVIELLQKSGIKSKHNNMETVKEFNRHLPIFDLVYSSYTENYRTIPDYMESSFNLEFNKLKFNLEHKKLERKKIESNHTKNQKWYFSRKKLSAIITAVSIATTPILNIYNQAGLFDRSYANETNMDVAKTFDQKLSNLTENKYVDQLTKIGISLNTVSVIKNKNNITPDEQLKLSEAENYLKENCKDENTLKDLGLLYAKALYINTIPRLASYTPEDILVINSNLTSNSEPPHFEVQDHSNNIIYRDKNERMLLYKLDVDPEKPCHQYYNSENGSYNHNLLAKDFNKIIHGLYSAGKSEYKMFDKKFELSKSDAEIVDPIQKALNEKENPHYTKLDFSKLDPKTPLNELKQNLNLSNENKDR